MGEDLASLIPAQYLPQLARYFMITFGVSGETPLQSAPW
jgi:hypothetical protein